LSLARLFQHEQSCSAQLHWQNTQTIKYQQETQLSLGQPTVLVVSDVQGHPKSMIFILSENQYATSYQ